MCRFLLTFHCSHLFLPASLLSPLEHLQSPAPTPQHIQPWTPVETTLLYLDLALICDTFSPKLHRLTSTSVLSKVCCFHCQKVLNLPASLHCHPLTSSPHPPFPGPPQVSPDWCLCLHSAASDPEQPFIPKHLHTQLQNLSAAQHCSFKNISLLKRAHQARLPPVQVCSCPLSVSGAPRTPSCLRTYTFVAFSPGKCSPKWLLLMLLKVGSGCLPLRAIKEARLVEREVCFILNAGNWGGVGSSLVAQRVKNLPAIQETQSRSLNQEDPLERKMATHSRILAWRIPWTEEPGGRQSLGSQRVRHVWATNIHTTGKGGWVSIQRPTLPHLSPLPENQWARAFIDRERGLHAETAQSVLTVILKLVIDGLTSVILTALGIVSLKFQHLFVSIFLEDSSWNDGSLCTATV